MPFVIQAAARGGGSSGGGGGALTTQWVGIPDPVDHFTVNPLTMEEPADHANWPSTAATGHYYVDPAHGSATDTNQGDNAVSGTVYGTPNRPRATIPTTVVLPTGGGGKLVIAGDGADYSGQATQEITCTGAGTDSSYNWVVGRYSTDRPELDDLQIYLNADRMICENINIINYTRGNHGSTGWVRFGGGYGIARHMDVGGVTTGSGSSNSLPSNTLLWDIAIHDFGQWNVGTTDFHALTISGASTDVWILDCPGWRNGADTVQVGDVLTEGTGPARIYIGGGEREHFDNGENAVDVKTADDVIISGLRVRAMTNPKGTGGGEGIVIHNSNRRVFAINCEVWECINGISVTGGKSGALIGNVCRGNTSNGMVVRGTDDTFSVVDNTFYNNPVHLNMNTSSNERLLECSGNLFGARSGGTNLDMDWPNITDFNATPIDYNFYDDLRVDNGSSVVTTLGGMQSSGKETNGVVGDPDFTDAVSADFTLLATSDAINAGTEAAIYGTFETLYGLDARVDRAGTARPATAGDWDIGAYERP